MHRAALSWVESVTDSRVVECQPLVGGMTSTVLALVDDRGEHLVLRLMTEEPWRTHGNALTTRERAAQLELEQSAVPAPRSVALDAEGRETGVAAHLMTRLPGRPMTTVGPEEIVAMSTTLATVHDHVPTEPFRAYQSWAPRQKWDVPHWSRQPGSWRRAFDLLAAGPPVVDDACLLHRDFGHRNLLWDGSTVTGLVDWVETSHGPPWLDAAHAATNLAVAFGTGPATQLLRSYAALTGRRRERYWEVMDAVGFLPLPGGPALFDEPSQRAGLDAWLHEVVSGA